MIFLSPETLRAAARTYRRQVGLEPVGIGPDGAPLFPTGRRDLFSRLPATAKARAVALQEALRWGEPYVFFPAPGVASWVTALVDGQATCGGLVGGEVLIAGESAAGAIPGLMEMGLAEAAARAWVRRLPAWDKPRIRQAAQTLHETFYTASGWKPALLEENRLKARQQEQIAAAMEEHRKGAPPAYPLEKERQLLALIRAGDRNGARRVLNEMLGVMFLFSPKLAILRARAIEMMGYLARAAIEDSPLLESLLDRNLRWTEKLIKARDFETLAHVLMQALDDFMEGIYLHGAGGGNRAVNRMLDYLQSHYTGPVVLADAARHAGLSPSRASHLLKQHTGRSLLQHVMRLRVQKAQQLLERSSADIADIAAQLGFCDQSYFTKHFRRLTGVTPARYRRGLAARPGAAAG
jgi:AraC-like DNA-binding protein